MMQTDNILPADFDGVFRFTNFSETDFIGKWGGVEYTFPALKTSPIIIANATPLEIQHIRKKFAKELAEREFYKSTKLKALEAQTPPGAVGSFKMAASYTPKDLESYIEQCLNPLPIVHAQARMAHKDEIRLSTDNKGNPVTKVLEEGDSLVGDGTVIA